MGACNCSMLCCTLLYVHSSIAIFLMGKRELVALLNKSSWCLVIVERLFLTVPRDCLWLVIVVLPDHTHLLFLMLQIANLKYHLHIFYWSLFCKTKACLFEPSLANATFSLFLIERGYLIRIANWPFLSLKYCVMSSEINFWIQNKTSQPIWATKCFSYTICYKKAKPYTQ